MTRPGWDDVWMRMADTIAARSRCDRARVGAVIVSTANHMLAASYNGPPHSWEASADPATRCPAWCPRGAGRSTDPGYADCPAAHAEMNALARLDASAALGGTLFVTTGCCFHCAKVVANTRLARVVARWNTPARNPWIVTKFLTDCGVTVDHY